MKDRVPWPRPSRGLFRWLAVYEPMRLVEWMKSGELSDAQLSDACEESAWNEEPPAGLVVEVLRCLEHESPMVREGAVRGLGGDAIRDPRVRDRLTSVAEVDKSPGVRDTARDVLAAFYENEQP